MAAPAGDDWEHIFRTPRRAHAIKLRVAQAPWSVIGSLFRAEDRSRIAHPWAWARLDLSGEGGLRWAAPGPDEPASDAFAAGPPPEGGTWGPSRLVEAVRFASRFRLRWDVPLHLAHVWVPTPAIEGADWSGSVGQAFLLIVCAGTRRATLWRATPLGSPVASAATRKALLSGVERALESRWGSAFDVRFEAAPCAAFEMMVHDRAGTSEAAVTEAALPVLGALAWAAGHHGTEYPGGMVYEMVHDAPTFARLLGAVDRADGALSGGGGVGVLDTLGEVFEPRGPAPDEARGTHHAHTRVGALVRRALEDWPDRELVASIEACVRANDPLSAATLVARVLNHIPPLSPHHTVLAEVERALLASVEPWEADTVGGE